MASSRTREGLYWILGNISSLEGCSGNGTGWSVEFPSLEMFKGCVDVVFRGLAVLGQQLGSMTSESFSNLKDPMALKSLDPSSSSTAPGCCQNEADHRHGRSLSHCHLQGRSCPQTAASDSIPAWGSVCTPGWTCPLVFPSGKRTKSWFWQVQGHLTASGFGALQL